MKVLLYTHDPMLTLVRTEQEAIELFGPDYCDDDILIEVPDDLAKEASETYAKLLKVSEKLREIRKHQLLTRSPQSRAPEGSPR